MTITGRGDGHDDTSRADGADDGLERVSTLLAMTITSVTSPSLSAPGTLGSSSSATIKSLAPEWRLM